MPKRSLIGQLEEALQAMLDRPEAETPRPDQDLDPSLVPLLGIARELRDLPREKFKARLKSDLERKSSMATLSQKQEKTTSKFIYEGVQTLTPYLVVQDAPALIDFVKQVFGAEEILRTIGSAGGIHCEVRIRDSRLMIGGGSPELSWRGKSWPTALHIYVEDTDAVYERALKAGGVSIAAPVDQPYGERSAGVKDQGGIYWYIATYKGKSYIPEGLRSVNPYLHPLQAEPLIQFLKQSFDAEEVAKYASPEGVVHHAQIRIGDSILEMGEAHGPYQPMATMFYLYVPDVDAIYRRALDAGATSIAEPADQPYGDRTSAVQDAFGNQWHLAKPIRKAKR